MAADKTEIVSPGDRIAFFLQKYRTILLSTLVLFAAALIGVTAFFSIRTAMQKKAIAVLEGYEERKSKLDLEDDSQSPEAGALLEEVTAFAPKSFGYAAAKAWSLAADIHAARGEWDKAEEAWSASAQKGKDIYLFPLSLYSAAVAAEEQGKLDSALEYYRRSLTFPGIFPAASRSRFNIGRIHEAQGEREKAAEAYRDLIEKAPESNWAKLAQSRIITLETRLETNESAPESN